MLAAAIHDMAIYIRDHVRLRMSSVALHCLDVTAADFEFHAGAAVAQTVKDNRPEIVCLNESFQFFTDVVLFEWPSVVPRNDQIEILIHRADFIL